MRAVRCRDGEVRVEDVPVPVGEGIRVRVRSAGICGSDLHLVGSGAPLAATLGHEFAGELDDGRLVAVEPLTPCGECDLCSEGRTNLCRLGPSIVLGVQQDGGMADEVRVPERCLVSLAENVPVRNACLVEPLAVAVHGIREADIEPGMRVAVVGAGSIGLCAVAAAQSAGADVTLIARHEAQRIAGDRLSAALESSGEYEVVIDCAGSASALQQAVGLCRPGGRLLLLASYWKGMELPGFAICLREIRVIPSSMYAHRHEQSDFRAGADLIAARPELAEILISHRFPLDEAARAFEVAADRESGAIKVVLEA